MVTTHARARKHHLSLALLLALSGVYGTADAAPKGVDLQDSERWLEAEKELQAKVKPLNEACGSALSASYDDPSYQGISYDDARANAACKLSFDHLKEVCRTEMGKTAVRNKVTKFTCRFSKTGTRTSLEGKQLVIHLDPKKTGIVGKQAGSYSWISAIKELL